MKKYKTKSLFLLLCLSVVLLLSGCGASSALSEQFSSEEPEKIEPIDLSPVGITDEVVFENAGPGDVVYLYPDGKIYFVYDDDNLNDGHEYCGEGQLSNYSLHDGYIELKIASEKTDYYKFSRGEYELIEENVKVDNPHYEKGDDIIVYLSGEKTSIVPQALLERDELYQFYSSPDFPPEERSKYLETLEGNRFYNKTKDVYIPEILGRCV